MFPMALGLTYDDCEIYGSCSPVSTLSGSSSWNDLTDIPSGFADNIDNESAGGSFEYPHDQDLNTTDDVVFNMLNTSQINIDAGGKIRVGNPPANGIGLSMDGNAFFIFSDTLTGSSPTATNILNNFNNYRGLLMRRSGTGTGSFIEGQENDGSTRFEINRYGSYETLGNGTFFKLFADDWSDVLITENQVSDLTHFTTLDEEDNDAYNGTLRFYDDVTFTPKIIANGGVRLGDTLEMNGQNLTAGNYGNFQYLTIEQLLTLNGNLNMNQNNITNIGQLQTSDGSALKQGDSGVFTNISQAINLQTNQTISDGVISHTFTDLQGEKLLLALQSGKNNSAGYWRNSLCVFGDLGSTDGNFLTNCRGLFETIGISSAFDYDTSNQGATLGVQWGLETQKLILHNALGNGLLNGNGIFSWTSNLESAFDVLNTSIHTNLGERLENVTTGAGPITILFITFEGETIGTQPPADFEISGDNSGGSIREWSVQDDVLCGADPCARAKGGNGADTRGMDTNFSTIEVSGIDLSFNYGSSGMLSGAPDTFEIFVNNNEGSGWVSIFSDKTTTGDVETQEQVSLPSSMENKSIVTMRFNHNANNQVQESYVDDIKINGTLGTETTVLTSQYDGQVIIGSQDHNDPTCDIFFNDTTNTMELGRGEDCKVKALNIIGNTVAICHNDPRTTAGSAYIPMGFTETSYRDGFIAPNDGSIMSISFSTQVNTFAFPLHDGTWNFTVYADGVETGAYNSYNVSLPHDHNHTTFEYGEFTFSKGNVLSAYAKKIGADSILGALIVCYEVAYD